MRINFYKENSGEWYADLPQYIESGGEKADLQMVSGADLWLDIVAQGLNNVSIEMSTEETQGYEKLELDRTDPGFPELGAYYRAKSYKGVDYSNFTMWLCPVTIYVFGSYPNVIYYTS